MSAIYYRITREFPLSVEEQQKLNEILLNYNSNEEVVRLVREGMGSLFYLHPSDAPGNLSAGFVDLPQALFPDRIDDFVYVLEHWMELLSDWRKCLSGANWHVSVEGLVMVWDEEQEIFRRPR